LHDGRGTYLHHAVERRQFLKHQAGEAPRTGLHFEQEAGGAGERVDEGGVRIFGERSSDFDKPCGLAMHLDQVGGTKGDQAWHARKPKNAASEPTTRNRIPAAAKPPVAWCSWPTMRVPVDPSPYPTPCIMPERCAAVCESRVRSMIMVNATAVRLPWPRPSNPVHNQINWVGPKMLSAKPPPVIKATTMLMTR